MKYSATEGRKHYTNPAQPGQYANARRRFWKISACQRDGLAPKTREKDGSAIRASPLFKRPPK